MSREISGCLCQDHREEMRQLRRSSASGRRQTGQTDRLSRSSLAESKQAAAVNRSQQGRQLQSLLLVCSVSQAAPRGAAPVFPPSLPPSPRAAPGRQAGITQPPCQECDSSAGARMSLYMPAFPAAKAARPTPPSLGKVSPSAELQALERPGVSRKIQNFGFYPSLRGEYFPHIFQDQQQANCSNGKCNLWLPGLL